MAIVAFVGSDIMILLPRFTVGSWISEVQESIDFPCLSAILGAIA